jgi:anti-sigma factor (TIGR02949 family)
MNCGDARSHLLDYQRGQLDPQAREQVHAHLETCAACAKENATEQALTELLEQRLPQHAAPLGLKRRLAARWPETPSPRPSWWTRWGRAVIPTLAVAAVLLAVMPLYYQQGAVQPGMVAEAVNDHLRILASQHPLEIESGGMHQVKPWFEGRLDFAPVVSFVGDQEFPLQGGAVGYFLDRKAAVFIFHRRLHMISLFVFRAEGLPWPTRGLERVGTAGARMAASRGFNVILWRSGELGYALVSDVDREELGQLAGKIAG